MTNVSSTLLSLLCVIGIGITSLSAQESCYEQYLREHNMKILTANDADGSYDELKMEVIARQVLRGEMPYAQYIADRYEQPTAKHGVPSQVLHKPLVLAIDTITGVCHLMAEDGTILADARIALVDSTWYMWISVDPLADKNISSSPYMYCNGNPIRFIDPDGRDVWDIDQDGNIVAHTIDKNRDVFYVGTVDENGVYQRSIDQNGNEKMMEFAYGTIEKYRTKVSSPIYPSNTCDVFYIRGDENGTKLFEFLADHVSALSHVELSLLSTGIAGNKGLNFLTTSHTKSSEYGQGIMWVSQLYTYSVRDIIHTHPTNPDPSQVDEESASAFSAYLRNQNRTVPSFYIYHVPTKKYISYGQ